MHRVLRSRSIATFAFVVAALGTARADEPAPPAEPEQPPAEQPPADGPPPEAAPQPAPAPAEKPTGILKGKISDPTSKEGLPAATIVITGEGGGSFATDLDGTYSLKLPPGTYTVTYSNPEYLDATRTVTIVEGQSVDLTFELA